MKKKNNSIKTIFLILLVLLGITSAITVLHNNSNNSDVNLNSSSSGLINDVNSSGIAILKKLESGVTSEGYPYQTYSYEI